MTVCGLELKYPQVMITTQHKIISFIPPLNNQVHCVSDFITLISDLIVPHQVTLAAFYETI